MAGLLPYQVDPAKKLFIAQLKYGVSADESETGVGKTPVALSVFAALRKAGKITQKPIVITLKSVVPSWRDWAETVGVDIDVYGYEWAQRHLGYKKLCGKGSRWLWHTPPESVIFDEAHVTKGMTTGNSKMLLSAKRQGAKHIHLMSASLFISPLELKAIGFALDLHKGKNFYTWLLRNGCKPGVFGGFVFPQNTGKEQKDGLLRLNNIREQIEDRTVRVRRKDVPGFPAVLKDVLLLEDENAEADKLAEELQDLYISYTQEGTDPSVSKITRILRLRQALELAKIPQLVEQGLRYARLGSVAFFVNFNESADLLTAKLIKHLGSCDVIRGGQSAGEREKVIKAYQNNLIPAVVINNKAGGAGISLHDPTGKVERTSFFMPTYSAVDMIQSEGRDHRMGGALARHFLVYFDSPTENHVAKVLRRKLQSLEPIVDEDLLGLSK